MPPPPTAFSRLDLLAALGTLALLAILALPVLGGAKPRSELARCENNLRLIGRALQLWGNDHNDQRPWRVRRAMGGTQPDTGTKPGNGWLEFAWVSNELHSPKILVCPADEETRKVARDFSANPDGGFLNFNYRANALSYIVSLDTIADFPRMLLSGDRNLRVDGVNGGCSSGVNNAARIAGRFSVAAWTNGIHGTEGNLLYNDGSVETVTNRRLQEAVSTGDDNGNVHLLMPR